MIASGGETIGLASSLPGGKECLGIAFRPPFAKCVILTQAELNTENPTLV